MMSTAVVDDTSVIPAGTWKSDLVHSWVGFQVRHMAVSTFRGELPTFDVTLTSDERGVRLDGTAPVTSILTRDADQTAHVEAPDFLDAERHPYLSLTASSIRRVRGDEVVVDATLTMKGISRPTTLRGTVSEPVEDPFGMTRLGIEVEGVVDRRDFDMTWQARLPGGGLALGNEITVSAQLELVRQ